MHDATAHHGRADEGPGMRIGEAAAASRTTPRALRFYERRGLLPPLRRSASGQREYGPQEVAMARAVRQLPALGLTVQDVRQVAGRLPQLARIPLKDCAGLDPSDPALDVIDRRLTAIDAEIARLTRLRDSLLAALPPGGQKRKHRRAMTSSAPHAFASHSTARSSPSPWPRVTFSRAVTCQRAVSCDSIASRHPQLLGISSGEAHLVPHHGALGRGVEPGEELGQRRPARAVRTHDR